MGLWIGTNEERDIELPPIDWRPMMQAHGAARRMHRPSHLQTPSSLTHQRIPWEYGGE